ncbi:glucan 1,4-alpha-maltotetraohydrolase domain-containing protein [Pontibacter sp. G13]|uniref:glucan 1,4-alpha-maltotetraohydrolase domain-containing protein n=1 Tax=Pontibacter sp. G13 TaxID=3074898 RepID=UPI00288B88F5|nr:glucan 1,4-alpha-maltotetraohydrolase domain-containing protein [Pontibacter sp. G13]WNJ20264.1 DUF1921 domain-containing protein [Pontibacter sp. G13]
MTLPKLLLVTLLACVSSCLFAQNSDVMIQGFNWESHSNTAGWWNVINSKATDLSASGIDVVWFPPSSDAAAPQGYLPRELYNLDSEYGTQAELQGAINALHGQGIKVLADIVINHRVGSTNWADFQNPTWGCWAVVANDEWGDAPGQGDCGGGVNGNPCGNWDTGTQYCAARDIDHTNATVRADLKAWMNWLKNTIGYDGWRYDFVHGFGAQYLEEYNNATSPYISVGENWNPDRQVIQNWIDATNQSSTAFDFSLKGTLQSAVQNNFSILNDNGNVPGLIAWSPTKSVTFLDNHDTGSTQGYWPFPGDKVMLGYAYILTHPGIPMVFWDHFYDWGLHDPIKELIQIRKNQGLTATSSVNIEASNWDVYAATIDNKVAMKIGPGSWSPTGNDWTLAASGTDYAVWTKGTVVVQPGDGMNVHLKTTWANPTVYFWQTTPTGPTTTWPGEPMVDNDGDGWYDFYISDADCANLIFSNNGASQTADLNLCGDGWYDNGWVPAPTGDNTAPVVSVTPGSSTFTGSITVDISATDNQDSSPTIYYTTDGSTPTTSSASATSSAQLVFSATATLQVFAEDGSGNASSVEAYTYTLSTGTSGDLRIHYRNSSNPNPYIYYWGTVPNGDASAAWPGDAMTAEGNGWYYFDIPNSTCADLIFSNNGGSQTNDLYRCGEGWYDGGVWYNSEPVTPVTYTMDGNLDATAASVATAGGANLYLGYNGTDLYMATQSANSEGGDVFIFVSDNPGSLTAAPWAKTGSVASTSIRLNNEQSNNWAGWTGAPTGSGVNAGNVLEGTLDVGAAFPGATTVYVAVGRYGTNNAGSLDNQIPAGDSDGDIESAEFYAFNLTSNRKAQVIETFSAPEIQAFPNPFSETLTFEITTYRDTDAQWALYNLMGQQVAIIHQGELVEGSHTFKISTANLPAGVYLYQMHDGQQRFTGKVVKR